jgi:hypothetical protein
VRGGKQAGLPEETKAAVLDHGPEYRRLCEGMGRGSGYARLNAIEGRGLFEKTWGKDCYRYRLTPLGLEVRAVLLEEQSK